MGLVTCAGADVLRGAVYCPKRGTWWASLRLDTPTAPSVGDSVTLAADGGFSLHGTVIEAGAFLDSAYVRLVGGAGGLGKHVSAAAYQRAQLRDPLGAIMSASGETQSSTIASDVLAVQLTAWTLTDGSAARALDEVCYAATAQLGEDIGWRILDDGTVWVGAETWPAATLPTDADVLEAVPDERRFVLGVATPALMPGVNLEGVGKVVGSSHFIEPDRIRTWALV